MADIPGLIEGASQGIGLGDEFLRHVERTKVLIHVLDAAGSEGRDPYQDFKVINNELELYSPELAKKKQIVAANKIDLMQDDEESLLALKSKIEKEGYKFFPICTLTGEGIRPLLEEVWKVLETTPAVELETPEKAIVFDVPKEEFIIEKKNDIFYVKGKRVEKLVSMTDFEDHVSLRRFDRAWKFMGLDKLLKKEGIQEGDTVDLYGVEFTYEESKEGSSSENQAD